MSRSPKTVIATVRGIGVAVITSTCGGAPALALSAARCSTPKRCCSSTTTRPRSANWTRVLEQRVRADHDAGLAPGGLARAPARRAAALSEPVSRATRVALVGAAEEAALRRGRRASPMIGAVVLLGEHLGRRQQRGLAAGVDDLEHRAQGDHGLAGADLALEQPVHRVAAAELGGDLLAHSALPVGEREGQPLVEPVEDPGAATGPRVGDGAPRSRHVGGPARSGRRRPRRTSAAARACVSCAQSSGRWIQRSACATSIRSSASRTGVGQRVRHVLDEVEREADGLLELPGVHAGGRGVERDQVGHRRRRRSPRRRTSASRGWSAATRSANHFSRPLNSPTLSRDELLGTPRRRCAGCGRRRSAPGCRPRRAPSPRGGTPCGRVRRSW